MARSRSKNRSGKPKNDFDSQVRKAVRRSQITVLITETAAVLNTLIRWGAPSAAIVLAAYFLSGKETGVRVEGMFKAFANQWVYLAVAALTGGGWAVDRRALRRRVKELSDEKKELETIIDGNRSSSGLSADGVAVKS